tara:strand:+ start:338 stop:844 length:507 start_codon:yes stop_codon:yes gene_type:complete
MKLLFENWRRYINESSSLNEGLVDDYRSIFNMSKKTQTTRHLPQSKEERSPEQEAEFRDILDNKRDAHRHILASAHYTSKFGGHIVKGLGELVELIGAVKSKIKGGPFDSGWAMDSANNKIGIDIGRRHEGVSLEQLNQIVTDLIDAGEFYTSDGTTLYKDKQNETTI